MGACLASLFSSVSGVGGEEIKVNGRRFRVLGVLGEGGYGFVYHVSEVPGGSPGGMGGGEFAIKRILVQSAEQLEAARAEVEYVRRLHHKSLIPLIDASVGPAPERGTGGIVEGGGGGVQEVCLLFPLYKDGTLLEAVQEKPGVVGRRFKDAEILGIFRQVCEGVLAMHRCDPPIAHRDIKPGNVLLSYQPRRMPLGVENAEPGGLVGESGPEAVVMDFGSARPARVHVSSRAEALQLQEEAASHTSAPYRAPELFDVPSGSHISEATDVWSLGCTLYASMYGGYSPFEYSLGQAGGSLALAAMSGKIQFPDDKKQEHPQGMRDLVTWMLQVDPRRRPPLDAVVARVGELQAGMKEWKADFT